MEADEEVTITYVPKSYSHEKRDSILQSHDGFSCSCLLCVADKGISAEDKEARTTMQQMLGRGLTNCARRDHGGIDHIEKFVESSMKSYNCAAYEGLPKVGLADVFVQLANMYLGGDFDEWQLANADDRNRAKDYFTAVLSSALKIDLTTDESTGFCEILFSLHSQPKAVCCIGTHGSC